MVVASGGWVQNASFPASPNSNLNINAAQNNKMTAKGILICRDNSHPFQERTLSLEQPVKIGRSVARARATPNNAIFDCRVLSRNHALLWYSGGKFYLQDTHSSNGTFVNNQRLSAAGLESTPKEVCSGDIVQFGVDVIESTKKVTHGCIVATLKLYLPDGKEAKASLSTSVALSVNNVTLEDLYKLNQVMQEASKREKALHSKLRYLQQLVVNTQEAANQSWKASIAEDRLLSWVETIESQLAIYSENYTEDKIRNELVKLHEEKAQYQNATKEALQKVLLEKLEVSQRLGQLEGRLNEAEEECQSLYNIAKYTQTELQELSSKYTEAQKKLEETTNKLKECEEKMNDMMQSMEQERQEPLKRIEDQSKVEKDLREKLEDSLLDSFNIYKQITAIKNYMQILNERMNSKLMTGEIMDTKGEENPIEAINAILNKLCSIRVDNTETGTETNFHPSKDEQDNQINSQDIDSNQLTNSDVSFVKEQIDDVLTNHDNLTEYILPPPSRRTLINGNVNADDSDIDSEFDVNSDTADDTCSITSDDVSTKSVVEMKKEEPAYEVAEEFFVPYKMEVRFVCEENDKRSKDSQQLQTVQQTKDNEETEVNVGSTNITKPFSESISEEIDGEKKDEADKDSNELHEECEEEHLEGDYVKTLKPLSKSDTQQSLHTKEFVLQAFIESMDSLKVEDNLESQQAVKKELENLKDWLICEPHDEIIEKLKELYYRAKNESQRIQELNEELVILKEKYSAFVEEKAELSKKYTTLKAQCGDLLNTAYTVPIHYVAPIVIMLIWMLLEKIF